MTAKLLIAAALLAGLTLPALAQETRSFTDDAGRIVEVPVHPLRIVSLHDSSLTVPLIELGVIPVGSFGRPGADGQTYMRGAATLTGATFENSNIAYVGGSPADLEAIAALEPDLILTSTFQEVPVEQLEKIAPTVVVEDNMRGELATFEDIAELTGTQDRLTTLKARYEGQIAQIRKLIDGKDITASIILTQNGQIAAWNTYGVLGKVLRDAGVTFPEIIEAIEGSERELFSGEQLQAFDADVMFVTYDLARDDGPDVVMDELNTIAPGFCEFLFACSNDQLVLLPREDAVARSYTALGLMAEAVLVTLTSTPLKQMSP
ncbi:protein translocase component YidC [Devosia yakushimensis]|uniref:Protein translocase component YidC n=1 Tax=Devosia yakushimensis TaxID=470028 RepID=A0ABQ5UG90_9HYPH|nr:ABC transporter substrate-binding protein [Devosia yakushimensis]GLQ10491.1 protein translocase component YidC [Devosia yakushimensis]